MEWIDELIRHLTISKTFAFSLAVTCIFLLFGNIWFPSYTGPLSPEWKTFAWAGLIFSSTLLLIWIVGCLWGKGQKCFKSLRLLKNSRNLSEEEIELLCIAGMRGADPLDIAAFAEGSSGLTKLRLLAIAESLHRKGLLEYAGYDLTTFYLSRTGKLAAISELEKQEKTNKITSVKDSAEIAK